MPPKKSDEERRDEAFAAHREKSAGFRGLQSGGLFPCFVETWRERLPSRQLGVLRQTLQPGRQASG